MKGILHVIASLLFAGASSVVWADTTIEMYGFYDNPTNPIGTIVASDSPYGLLLKPNLKGLPAGLHGFHLHENGQCTNQGSAAGGHYDPRKTGKHLGPYNRKGHLGDLPVLFVHSDGTATLPILAPRLKLKNLNGRTLIIHAGPDNYSDEPQKLGGGGSRIACGVVTVRNPHR